MHLTQGWDREPVLSEAEGSISRAPRTWDLFEQPGFKSVSTPVRLCRCSRRFGKRSLVRPCGRSLKPPYPPLQGLPVARPVP